MTNVYCVNDKLLQSDLQTSGKFTAVKNMIYQQRWKFPTNFDLNDVYWSLDKQIGGKSLNNSKGSTIDPTVPFHEIKGYYTGKDNLNHSVYFEVYMRSISNNSHNQLKLHKSEEMRHTRLNKTHRHSHAMSSDMHTMHAGNHNGSHPHTKPPTPAIPAKSIPMTPTQPGQLADKNLQGSVPPSQKTPWLEGTFDESSVSVNP